MASKIENTEYLGYSNADSNDVNLSEKTTQLARKPSADGLTQGQPQVPTSSLSDVHAAHGAPSFQRATPKGLDYPASLRISHERNHSSNDLPSHPSGVNDKPRDIVGHHGKLVAPDVSPEKEIARSEDERLVELERKLAAVLATQTERDRPIAQLTDELAQNSVNATEEKRPAGLEQREMQAKLDEMLLSRGYVLQKASRAIEANKQSQQELVEVRAELEAMTSELAAVHLRDTDVENGWAKGKAAEADTSRAQIAAGLVNTDEVTRRLMERTGALEAKLESPRKWNKNSFEMMECRNETPASQSHTPSNSEPERPNQQPDYLRILQDQFDERGRVYGHRYSYTEDASARNSEFLESSVNTDSKHYSGRRSLETASHSLLDVLLHSSN